MARYHAKSGRLYVASTSTGEAVPLAAITGWNMDFTADRIDVTAFGDSNRQYVQGYQDAQFTFAGFRDSGAKQLLSAAQDAASRKWYFYEDASVNTIYWYETAFFDFSTANDVNDAAKISGTGAANSSVGTQGLT
jgi:hypothetical protein